MSDLDDEYEEPEPSPRYLDETDPELHQDESDIDAMSSDKVLEALESAWLNEKFAPELLPHQTDLIDCLLEQISYMEQNLKKLKKGDLRINVHTMELMRIKYVISSYLRQRLSKIEEFAVHLLQEDSERSTEEVYMTPSESQFAREYITNMESLFKSVALNHFPARHNEFELSKASSKPNFDAHVFLKSKREVPGVIVPGTVDDAVNMSPESQHIIRYRAIANFVKNGAVQLI